MSVSNHQKNSNTILLMLPNVNASPGENESESSEKYDSIIEPGENGESPFLEQPKRQGENESTIISHKPLAREEYSVSYNHKNERLSPELQDVYKILLQLPSFSHSSWSGFNNVTDSATQKRYIVSPINTRILRHQENSRNKRSRSKGKQDCNYEHSESIDENQVDSMITECSSTEDNDGHRKPLDREVVKMHSINLYQSILPHSLFSRTKLNK